MTSEEINLELETLAAKEKELWRVLQEEEAKLKPHNDAWLKCHRRMDYLRTRLEVVKEVEADMKAADKLIPLP